MHTFAQPSFKTLMIGERACGRDSNLEETQPECLLPDARCQAHLGFVNHSAIVVRERLLHSIAELLRLGLWDRGGMMMNHEPAATLLHKDIGGLHVGAKEVFVKRG